MRLPKIFLCAAAGLALVAPAMAAKTIIKRGFIPGGVPDLPCTIQVDFTSVAAGPDYDAFGTLQRYIIDTRDVDAADAWGWGKEGEFTLCLTVHDLKEAPKIFDDLSKLVPAKPNGNGGPTVVKRGAAWKS
ncbi:MAG: hypothetical protein K2Y05_00780 [Hyphomicrobiaceae bacterium]|nr:hypothetical protein [Hyphomicrobiaceae bacterium]